MVITFENMLKNLSKIFTNMLNSISQYISHSSETDLRSLLEDYPIECIQFNTEIRFHFELKNINRFNTEELRHLYWLGSCHYNGYEREKYLRLIITNYKAGDLNRIILRLLDWVKQIREISDNWIIDNLSKIDYYEILQNLPIIQKIENSKKQNTVKCIPFLKKYLYDSFTDFQRISKLVSVTQRRYIYNIFIQNKDTTIIDVIITDKDPSNRTLIFNPVFKQSINIYLEKLSQDRSVFIRTRLIFNIYFYDINTYKENVFEMLIDSSRKVRNAAQYLISKTFHIDFNNYYKANYSEHKNFISFLSDTPISEDKNLFINSVLNDTISKKYSSIQALAKIDELYSIKEMLFDLLFTNNRIQRIVIVYLPKYFTVMEIISKQDKFLENGIDGIRVYLTILLNKSFYETLNQIFCLMKIPDYQEFLEEFILKRILSKRSVYENINEKLRHSLQNNWRDIKTIQLKNDHLISEVDFILKTVKPL